MRLSLVVALVASVGAAHASRTSVLVVSVGDAKTGAVITDAQVRLPALGRIVRTASNGEARFIGVAEGRYRVQVRSIGYEPDEIEVDVKGDTARVHFALEKIKAVLDTVQVKASRSERHLDEFETRRKQGIGRFITDSVLVAERAKGLQLLLITNFPGLKVVGNGVQSMGGISLPSVPTGRTRLKVGGGCGVLIFVDGHEFTDAATDVAGLQGLQMHEIAGIEFYTRITAPVQYRPPGGYCKVILIWTKW